MCTLQLPKKIIEHIDRARRHCLWRKSNENSNRPQSLAAWNLVCKPKDKGGLGIIDLHYQNTSLLMKHLYKFYNEQDLPCVKLWNKYYHNVDLPPHACKEIGSFWWKNIFRLIPLFRAVIKIRVKGGDTVLFWKDNWLPHGQTLADSHSSLFSFSNSKDISCFSFISNPSVQNHFNLPLSSQAMTEWRSLENIIQHTSLSSSNDSWDYPWDGLFSHSKKIYSLFFAHLQPAVPLTHIWKSKCTLKLKVFLWLLLMSWLNTLAMLQHKNLLSTPNISCGMCNSNQAEDLTHLFFACPFAAQCWSYLGIQWHGNLEFMNMILVAKQNFGLSFFYEVIVVASWNIWLRRNDLIFHNIRPSLSRWKCLFKEDFTLLLHRVNRQDIPAWQSWIDQL